MGAWFRTSDLSRVKACGHKPRYRRRAAAPDRGVAGRAAVALDADGIVGFLDRSDAIHESATKLIGDPAADSLVASAVTLAELLTGAMLGHHDERVVRGFFADLVASVVPVDSDLAEAAVLLRSRSMLRMPDALVLATATGRPEVSALITGDDRIAKAAGDLDIRRLES